MRRLWSGLVWMVERADILPLLVFVSAWHYAGALATHDPLPVAVALGILIDLGHYRAVKSYLHQMEGRRFAVLVVLTGMTGYYHWLWYRDILLAAGVPVLIICLALVSRWEHWERQAAPMRVQEERPKMAGNGGRNALPIDRPVAGDRPVIGRADWRALSASERAAVAELGTAEIMVRYGIDDRKARKWRERARMGGEADE